MSTFDGYIKEFPDITVDHFTRKPNRPTPRAAFLSHVHKDHLVGLETYDASFIYCSQATKELLLRLQTRRDRLNFAEGFIEKRICTYAHLNIGKRLLKALPLNTPTRISLTSVELTVTLIDANHCPGATMFLLESDTSAVLYTGDIRAEPCWIQSISKSPVMAPYFSGIRRLDCLYFDTTFASVNDSTRHFPDRASSLQELIGTMAKYPTSTVFHFNAWTFGYRRNLSTKLTLQIHVDTYRQELFKSIKSADGWQWGSFLSGHADKGQKKSGIADVLYEGVLTEDPNTRFHSCDSKGACPVRDQANVVQIIPITTRMAIARKQTEDNSIDTSDLADRGVKRKMESDDSLELSPKRTKGLIVKEPGHTFLDGWWIRDKNRQRPQLISSEGESLSYYIYVPLSRHSSLNELRSLVTVLKPRDLFPCVEDPEKLTYLDLKGCFGDLCDLSNCIYLRNRGSVSHANSDEALQRVLAERWAYDDISEDEPDDDENSVVSTANSEHESDRHHSPTHTHVEERSEAPRCHVSEAVVMQIEVVLEDGREINKIDDLTPRQSPDEHESERHHSPPPIPVEECPEVPQGHLSEAVVMQIEVVLEDGREINVGDDLTSRQSPEGRDVDLGEDDDVLFNDCHVSNIDMIDYYMEVARKGGNIGLKSVDGGGDEVLL